MKQEQFVALRFMFKGTERGTFSPLTLFAWVAIAVGVAAMSVLLSVMYGFESALTERLLKAYPHVLIKPKKGSNPIKGHDEWTQRLKSIEGVTRVTPFVETEMIVQLGEQALGVVVLGLPESELTEKIGIIEHGSLPSATSKRPQVMVGSQLAPRISAHLGAHVKLISPIETTGAMGLIPKAQTFEVAAIYGSGHYDFDQQYLMLRLEDAQSLLKRGDAITGWHVWGKDYQTSAALQQAIAKQLPEALEAQSWMQFNSALFKSLKLEQYSMFSILTFAIIIAVMNIAITLTMYVTQKQRNVGVLRALGASRAQIRKIFVWQGAFLGGVGLMLGGLLTIAALTYIKFSDLLLPEIYYDRSIPIEIRPWSLVMIYTIAIALIFLATIFPARKAMDIDPIEAIRQ